MEAAIRFSAYIICGPAIPRVPVRGRRGLPTSSPSRSTQPSNGRHIQCAPSHPVVGDIPETLQGADDLLYDPLTGNQGLLDSLSRASVLDLADLAVRTVRRKSFSSGSPSCAITQGATEDCSAAEKPDSGECLRRQPGPPVPVPCDSSGRRRQNTACAAHSP